MIPATWPRPDPLDARLLRVDPRARTWRDGRLSDLPRLLRAGDLLVVNDAATLPASLPARGPRGEPLELRLAGAPAQGLWTAVLFGAGDWRTRTEDRPAPPALTVGDVLTVATDLSARVARVHPEFPRLLDLCFDREGAALWSALYRHGRPVQYSYLQGPLDLWHVQTAYATRPWAAELPSAGRPLTWGLLHALARSGVRVAVVTHAAGLSSTGDPGLDARLPLPERYEVPAETVAAVTRTHALGGRVVAVGTTAVRALEAAAEATGVLRAGEGTTLLVIDGSYRPRVTDGLLTGMHEPGSSHFALLTAFAPPDLLQAAWSHAEAEGYLGHEFGDASLVLAG